MAPVRSYKNWNSMEAKLHGAVFMEKTDSDLISFLRENAN